LLRYNITGELVDELDATNAFISRVQFSDLDASSTDTFHTELVITPQAITHPTPNSPASGTSPTSALVDDEIMRGHDTISIKALRVEAGTGIIPVASLTLDAAGVVKSVTTSGDGPVDAIFMAIREAYPHTATLQLFQISAVTEGTDAQAQVSVRLEEDGRTVTGKASDTDTMVAAAYAYVNALNKLLVKREKREPEALTIAR
jgi:hypothetical protein